MSLGINRFDIARRRRNEAETQFQSEGAALLQCMLLGAAALVTLAAAAPALAQAGPFAAESPLFLHAPAFDKIRDSDFKPALEEGMTRARAEVERIASNSAAPTFDNTLVALERSGRMLDRVTAVFFALNSANTNDTLQKVAAEEAPRLSALQDFVHLNPKLFARVKAVYDQRAHLGLSPEAEQLAKVTYDAFVKAGAKLSPAEQTRLRARTFGGIDHLGLACIGAALEQHPRAAVAHDENRGQHQRRDIGERALDRLGLEAGAPRRAVKQRDRQPAVEDRQPGNERIAAERAAVMGGEEDQGVGQGIAANRRWRRRRRWRHVPEGRPIQDRLN